jgi:hypothetical protein
MAAFLTVAAKHCGQAEHSLRLAAGFFNDNSQGIALKGSCAFGADPFDGLVFVSVALESGKAT